MSDENPDNQENGLVIFSIDDENIEELGKILSIKYSLDFYSITLDTELNLKEIAKKIANDENPRLPNATHHKDRLLKVGLIKKKKKLQRKKGHILNYYKGNPFILIVPSKYKKDIEKSKELNKFFIDLFRSHEDN